MWQTSPSTLKVLGPRTVDRAAARVHDVVLLGERSALHARRRARTSRPASRAGRSPTSRSRSSSSVLAGARPAAEVPGVGDDDLPGPLVEDLLAVDLDARLQALGGGGRPRSAPTA